MKFLEIRDRATFIPVMAARIIPSTNAAVRLYRAAGYRTPEPPIIVLRLDTGQGTTDLYDWGDARTMSQAARYIEINYENLIDGDVIDVEFILKETAIKKDPQ